MCGLPCSGKTTRAKQIEQEHSALRLTKDEWLMAIFGERMPARGYSLEEMDTVREPLESALFDLALRVLTLGVDVVLDFGVWARSERESFRARAAAAGARSELHFMDIAEEDLLTRLHARNGQLPPGTFHIEDAQIKEWAGWFERPTRDELPPREPAA
jgi:predicted kinase